MFTIVNNCYNATTPRILFEIHLQLHEVLLSKIEGIQALILNERAGSHREKEAPSDSLKSVFLKTFDL